MGKNSFHSSLFILILFIEWWDSEVAMTSEVNAGTQIVILSTAKLSSSL